jgi:phosphatidylserine/phosphatidylglycerophosphate/cardiolipin synthase-like enzyme
VTILDGKTAWRVHENARSALLIDGREYFRAFYQAASEARRSILLLGWQFDSDVELLRGDDLPEGIHRRDVELMRFLDRLCRQRPELEVRVLAWDHSFFFALEREVLQKLVFDVVTSEQFVFRWDGTVPLGGSHHQKVAIVDGNIAFTGSQDICHHRWDDSSHRVRNPERLSRDRIAYGPYHEVQAVVTGLPARSLVELFVERWRDATGEELDPGTLVAPRPRSDDAIDLEVTLPMPPARIGLSRSIPEVPGRAEVREVEALLTRAIREAKQLVYIESQYLSSCAMRDALIRRMRDRSKPKLDVVALLPCRPEAFKEEISIGLPQAEFLDIIRKAAQKYGHSLGLFNVAAVDDKGRDVHCYIHSKVMIVDDRFMTVGSANFTNRSMSLDSEVNLTWEAAPGDRAARPLRNAIRRARVRLLLEHVGAFGPARDVVRAVVPGRGLVARLDALAKSGTSRLREHAGEMDAPNVIAKVVREIAGEYLDPTEGSEPPPFSRPSAARAAT